jgi:hypothetical protein
MSQHNAGFLDPTQVLVPHIERLAHHLGAKLARSRVFASCGAALPEIIKTALKGATMMGFGVLTIPRSAIPLEGKPGDVLCSYLNDFIDSFGGGLREGMDHGADIDEKFVDEVADLSAQKADEKQMHLLFGMLHSTPECSVIKDAESIGMVPGGKNKDGSERKAAVKDSAKPRQISLAQGMREGMPLCPRCNVDSVAQPSGKPKADAKLKARSLAELYYDLLKTEPERAAKFWSGFTAADAVTRHRMREAFRNVASQDNLLKLFAETDSRQWNHVLDAVLGEENKTIKGILTALTAKFEKFGANAHKRFAAEGREHVDAALGWKALMDSFCSDSGPIPVFVTPTEIDKKKRKTWLIVGACAGGTAVFWAIIALLP